MSITIDTVVLRGDLKWIDEFGQGSDLVGQQEAVTITGALIVQASAQQAGRLMTLQTVSFGNGGYAGVCTRAQIDALRTLAATPGATFTVTLNDGRTFTAMFRRSNVAAVQADALVFMDIPPEDGDEFDAYTATISMILV